MLDLAKLTLCIMLLASVGIGVLNTWVRLSNWQCAYLTFLAMVGIVITRMAIELVVGH